MRTLTRKPRKKGGSPRLGRVLVVEDDPVLALEIEAALRDTGFSGVTICPGTAAAMAALEKGRPAAIVLDVHLTDSDDGWALAELVDMLGPRRPAIAFSTGSPDAIPPAIAEMGRVFTKPYDPVQLAQSLASLNRPGFFARLRRRGMPVAADRA